MGELTEGPTVNNLQVANSGEQPVLLLQGEVLAGGWQTRVLTSSVLVPAGDSTPVPVACVEQGRWGGATRHARSRTTLPIAMRAMLASSVATSHHRSADQGRLWQSIATRQQRLGVTSSTSSYLDDRAASRQRIKQLVTDWNPAPGQRGVVVAVGGRLRALELFDQPKTLASAWLSLLEGYAAEALDTTSTVPGASVRAQAARDFAEKVQHAYRTDTRGAGRGSLISGSSPVIQTGRRWRNRIVHLAAFC